MKCERYVFDSYITPTRSITPAITKVNGLSRVHKKLFQNGNEVTTLPQRIVFNKLIIYLKSLGKKCILVAHNCIFDSTRLVSSLKKLSLLEDFQSCVEGFSDTLILFRIRFPIKKNWTQINDTGQRTFQSLM